MRVMCFVCLLLCVFLVSQNMNTAKRLARIDNCIGRLENSMAATDSVNVLKAEKLLDDAQKAIDNGDTEKAAVLISRSQNELKGHVAETKAAESENLEAKAVKSLTKSFFGFLSDAVKSVGENL